jgi:uncharacterized repeat protein (TIGR01451 family)
MLKLILHRLSNHFQPQTILVSALLLSGLSVQPVIAASAPPGVINNQATGSFVDDIDTNNTVVQIESNIVQVTVAEVAGITVTAGGTSGSTVTGGLVYFDFILTNVGNDSTQFFIPDAPSSIVGGTKSGDIKIISYDSDGSGAAAAAGLNVIVPSGGATTRTLSIANNGSIPAGATILIRVPILISATSGNVEVTMGDTTTANAQNQPYKLGNKDIYTVDNNDGSFGETDGVPANGEREASLTQSLPISITTNTANAPTVTCSVDRRIFNTAYNNVNGGFLTSGRDTYWDSAIGTASGPPPTSGWIDAYNVEAVKPAWAWLNTPYGDSAWISYYSDAHHDAVGRVDAYFRYQFNLSPTVDVNSFQLKMDFFGDNSVADIFINGISQKGSYPTVLPQPIGGGDPYQFRGFEGTGKAALTLTQNWQTGPNEIIVQVKSDPGYVGFVAESQPSYLCKSDLGDAPISYGTAPHSIITNPKVYIGSVPPDADNYRDANTPVTTPAYNDNTDGGDEDAFTTPLKAPTSGTYKLTVPVHNTSGGSATLHAWIDFNKDGKFGVGEYQSVSVPSNATTANLSWTVPSGTTLGSTYARFRLTTSILSDNAETLDVDERSTIGANDGEVEDYSIDLVGNPNLLLVKRITKINGLPQKRNGDSLANYENEAANLYDDNDNATPIAPNLRPTTNKWPLIPNTTHPALIGAIDGGTIKPTDSIEYTIYFLSTGDIPAKSVLFCDRVPENVTFIPTAFNSLEAGTGGLAGADRGIAVNLGSTLKSYTNIADGDFAQYFPPGTTPPSICGAATKDNGAVVVNLGNIPNATSVGTPPESYGFVRFQGRVK